MQKWIKIKDKVPEKMKAVLVYDPSFQHTDVFCGCMRELGDWRDYVSGTHLHKASHWMPFPAPPKEDNDS